VTTANPSTMTHAMPNGMRGREVPIAGSRQEGTCRGCRAKIVFIYSAAGKWIPCNMVVCKVDGERMLVFADGVVARRHQECTVGHESHFATCPKSEEFRKSEKKKDADEDDKAAAIGCGCLGPWVSK